MNARLAIYVIRAIFLASLISLLPIFIAATLLTVELDGSLFSPDFYKDRLLSADAYNFILDDLARSGLKEASEIPPSSLGLRDNPILASGLSAQQIVRSLNRAMPPEWARAEVEENLEQPLAFLAGDRDDFTVRLNVSDRLPEITEEVGSLIESVDTRALLVDPALTLYLDDLHGTLSASGFDVDRDRLLEVMATVFDAEWSAEQVAMAYYSAAPYLTGQSESFEVRIDLAGRRGAVLQEVKNILGEIDWRAQVSEQVIDPMIQYRAGQTIPLASGVEISQSDVIDIFRESVPKSKFDSVAEDIAGELVGYAFGASDGARVAIDVSDVKQRARPELVKLAQLTLDRVVSDLPECEAGRRSRPSGSEIPECFPTWEPDRSAAMERVDAMRLDLDHMVESAVLANIPDEIVLTEGNFWAVMGSSGISLSNESVDEIRALLRDGVVYGSDDLKTGLNDTFGPESVDLLEEIRRFFRDGLEITERDLAGPSEIKDIRRWAGLLSQVKWALLALTALLVAVCIFAFSDWTGRGRIAWTAGYVAISSAFVYVLFGPVFSWVLDPLLDVALRDVITEGFSYILNFPATGELIGDKVVEIILDSVRTVVRGVANKAAICAVALGVVCLVAANRDRLAALRRRTRQAGRRRISHRPLRH